MAIVHSVKSLMRTPTAALFEGAKHGDGAPLSIFVVESVPGKGVGLHTHPYDEVLVVQEGEGRFTVGGEELALTGGQIVVVPAETPHGFENTGEGPLKQVTVHASPELIQTDL